MAGNTRIPKAEITGLKGALVKRFSRKLLGEVPTPLGVYWNNRPVLEGYLAISGKPKKWKACDSSLKSFAHMAVASLVGCTWCLDFGYFQAHNEDLDLDKAREVPRWRESDVFTPLERDVMAYAEAIEEALGIVTRYFNEDQCALSRQCPPKRVPVDRGLRGSVSPAQRFLRFTS